MIHGPGEEISLAKFAAELFEGSELAARFDALGNYFQIHMMRERNDEARNFAAFTGLLDSANEGTIDLQHVHGETVESTQGRMAGPKIVDAEKNTHLLELRTNTNRGIRIAHRRGLGDFQLHAPRFHLRFVEGGFHFGDQIALRELAG